MAVNSIQRLEESMMPVFHSLVNSLFDNDFQSFLEYHPPVPEGEFAKAVSILKPLGKPVKLEYLGQLNKPDRIKVLCKATYSDTSEELLWDFNLTPDGTKYQLINMGFDK